MLKQLRDAFKSRGVELVMVYQPTRGLVNRSKLKPEDRGRFNYDLALRNYRQALARFEQVGLSVPDLSPLTDEQQEHPFYFRRDQHWTPYGAERTARLVAETVKRIPAFETIEKKEFVSQRIGLMGKTGTMQKVASQLCGTTYAPQYIDQFATEPKAESGSDELFGDSTPPQITLVGTSHSGPNYNFGGFLEEHIGADVLNVAFPGSGLEGSMLAMGGTKGAMLALVVELLVTTLTGAHFGAEADTFFKAEGNQPRLGQVFIVIDPEALGGQAVYSERIEALVLAMLADVGVRLPGQRRIQLLATAQQAGVDVPQSTWDAIRALC